MAWFIPALISGLSALSGGLLNREKKQETSGTSTTNSSQTQASEQTGHTTPTYDPLQLQMRNMLLGQYAQRAFGEGPRNMVQGMVDTGVNNINQSGEANQQAIRNALASRGLSYSPAAGVPLAMGEQARIGQITDLRNQAPMMEEQLRGNYLKDFSSFLSGLPTGSEFAGSSTGTTTGTSTTNQQGTVTTPGNPLGGAISGGASTLATMYGLGAFGGPKPKSKGSADA